MFRIARNPDPGSTLPYLLWVPVGVGAARAQGEGHLAPHCQGLLPSRRVAGGRGDRRGDTGALLHPRGVAIDLVLDRYRENRSQFVVTTLQGGREGIFWQTAKTTRKTRPGCAYRRAAARQGCSRSWSTPVSGTRGRVPAVLRRTIDGRRDARRRPRCATRTFRSCSARTASSPRSGPTASWALLRPTPTCIKRTSTATPSRPESVRAP